MSNVEQEDEPQHRAIIGCTGDAGTAHVRFITPEAFYDDLDAHDWHYSFSDDPKTYKRGTANEDRLKDLAERGGTDYKALFRAFAKHYSTGEPWGNAQWDKPQRPVGGVVILPDPPVEMEHESASAPEVRGDVWGEGEYIEMSPHAATEAETVPAIPQRRRSQPYPKVMIGGAVALLIVLAIKYLAEHGGV
jgi:hypothetical protein